MIIDNVYVFTPDKAFVKGGIILDGDKIRQVYEEKDAPQLSGDVMDGKGCYAIPGLIDLHFQSNSQNTQETLQNRAFLVSRRYIMTSIRVLFVCHGRAMESQ